MTPKRHPDHPLSSWAILKLDLVVILSETKDLVGVLTCGRLLKFGTAQRPSPQLMSDRFGGKDGVVCGGINVKYNPGIIYFQVHNLVPQGCQQGASTFVTT